MCGVQVREEQSRLRPDPSKPLTGELLNEMTYTRQVRGRGDAFSMQLCNAVLFSAAED